MKFNKKTLPNGLKIITVPMKDNPTVTVLVLVAAGSKYEDKKQNGLSHFLEHMCFKGTAKRPSALLIRQELDGIGANYNAFTSLEYTGYYAKAEAKHFGKILDVVSDIYLNPTLSEEEIEKEKGVIVGEINMRNDDPMSKVWNNWYELLYGDQPAGRPVVGDEKKVRSFSRADFINYRGKHYSAGKTVVIIAGGVKGDSAEKAAEKAFRSLSARRKFGKAKVREAQKRPRVVVQHKKTDQTHLVLGVRAFNMYDKDEDVLDLLALILGGNSSSRLFQKVREEMGAGYYVGADSSTHTDHGFLSVSAGIHNDKVPKVVSAILSEMKRIAKEPVPKEELERAKDFVEGAMAIRLEPSNAFASFYGFQELLRRKTLSPEEVIKRIRAVKASDIIRVARKIFRDDRLNMALIGPFKNGVHFSKILKF